MIDPRQLSDELSLLYSAFFSVVAIAVLLLHQCGGGSKASYLVEAGSGGWRTADGIVAAGLNF